MSIETPQSNNGQGKTWRGCLGLTGLTFFGLALGLVGAEFYLQSGAPGRQAIPFYNKLHPYAAFRPIENDAYISADKLAMSHFQSQVFHYTDANGFRVSSQGYVIPIEKRDGELRVAVLGGSAIQLGSTYDTTLPGALKRALQSRYRGRRIEVINAGIVSCVSRQSIAHFLFSVAKYRPDIVVLYDGVNDLGMPMTYESRPNFPYNFQTLEAAWDEYRDQRQAPLWNLALDRSQVWKALRRGGKPVKGTAHATAIGPNARTAREVIEDRAYVEGFVRAYLENWEILIELSRSYGFQPLFILQPTGGFDRDYALPLMQRDFGLGGPAADEWIQAFRVLYGETERQMQSLRQRQPGVKFLNWSESLYPAKDAFWDLVHVYDETNGTLAERLAAELAPIHEPASR